MTEEKSLSDRVYDEICVVLTQGEYKPHDFIVEADVCRRFEVSRTTAVRVLQRLTAMGYLNLYPRKGYRINVLRSQEYSKMMRLRVAIERMVVQALITDVAKDDVRRLLDQVQEGTMSNMKFHLAMAELLDDRYTLETLQRLLGMQEVTLRQELKNPAVGSTHDEILRAVLLGDAAAALDALDRDLAG